MKICHDKQCVQNTGKMHTMLASASSISTNSERWQEFAPGPISKLSLGVLLRWCNFYANLFNAASDETLLDTS